MRRCMALLVSALSLMATAYAGQVLVFEEGIAVDFRKELPGAVIGIEFVNTVRVTEDGRVHGLPPHGGSLELLPARRADKRFVAKEWLSKDVVLMPVREKNAMWVNFVDPRTLKGGPIGVHASFPAAIIMATGGVNVFTGEPFSYRLSANKRTGEHNYVVAGSFFRAGHQRWVDGYSVRKGVVRQFVAASRESGTSVEEYFRGSVQWGGIQVVVYPLKKSVWDLVRDSYEESGTTRMFSRKAAPVEKHMSAGGEIRQDIQYPAYPPEAFDETKGVKFWVTMVDEDVWPLLAGTERAHPHPFGKKKSPFEGVPGVDQWEYGKKHKW